MTKEELTKIIENSVKEHDFDFKDYDREDVEYIFQDIQGKDDTLYFDTISYWWHPIAIQVFTDVEFKGKNYSVIIDFEMPLENTKEEFIERIWEEYERALKNKEIFKS